jgi:hypothetical protein
MSEVIGNEIGATKLQTYLAIIVTEATGIAVAIVVMVVWKSWFMFLWLSPLILKLLSALLAVPRDPLQIPISSPPDPLPVPKSSTENEKPPLVETKVRDIGVHPHKCKKFEIRGLSDGFMVMEGDEDLILPFFRHYGHPIRNRFREYIQILIIIAFGFVFPIGLLSSLLWMPTEIQYMWMSYQLYATFAMHLYRYTGGQTWATTEERIAEHFQARLLGEKHRIYFQGKQSVLMVELEMTYHDRFRDGKLHMEKLLFGEGFTDPKLTADSRKPSAVSSTSTTTSSVAPSLDLSMDTTRVLSV